MNNPFNPTYTWLHPVIKQLIQTKLEAGEVVKRHTWQPEAITAVLFELFPQLERCLWVEVSGVTHGVRLDKLTLSRLMALDAFMDEREQLWQNRLPLAASKTRPSLVNTYAVHCQHPYAKSYSGLLLRHSTGGYEHLGDCWLVKLKRGEGWGSTHWMPAADLYPLSIPVLDLTLENSEQPSSKTISDAP